MYIGKTYVVLGRQLGSLFTPFVQEAVLALWIFQVGFAHKKQTEARSQQVTL